MTQLVPLVSVIVLVKNELPQLSRSIPVVLQQDAPYDLELIVIDSGSTDGSVQFLENAALSDARIRLVQIDASEFHHARTRNLGATLARGRYVAFLGGDAVPCDNHWLQALLRPLCDGADPLVVATYGRQVPRPSARLETTCRMTHNYGDARLVKALGIPASAKERYFFSSVNCCIDGMRVERPFFDTRFPVSEDISLSKRLIDDGFRTVYEPQACVEHSHDYSMREILRRYFDHGVVYHQMGLAPAGVSAFARDARRYFIGSVLRTRGHGAGDLARVTSYFVCSAVGLQLGLHAHRLPRSARRALSVYGTGD